MGLPQPAGSWAYHCSRYYRWKPLADRRCWRSCGPRVERREATMSNQRPPWLQEKVVALTFQDWTGLTLAGWWEPSTGVPAAPPFGSLLILAGVSTVATRLGTASERRWPLPGPPETRPRPAA